MQDFPKLVGEAQKDPKRLQELLIDGLSKKLCNTEYIVKLLTNKPPFVTPDIVDAIAYEYNKTSSRIMFDNKLALYLWHQNSTINSHLNSTVNVGYCCLFGLGLDQKNPDKAIEYFLKVHGKNGINCSYGLGVAYFDKNEVLTAIQYLEKVDNTNQQHYVDATAKLKILYEARIQLLQRKLRELYVRLDRPAQNPVQAQRDPLPEMANLALNNGNNTLPTPPPIENPDQLAIIKSFQKLSCSLDAFDESLLHKYFTEYEILDTEIQICDASIALFIKKIEEAGLRNLCKETISALQERLKNLQVEKSDKDSKKIQNGLKIKSITEAADEKELQRELATEKRFFDTTRTKSEQTRNLAIEMQNRRLQTQPNEAPIITSGTPVRRLITAERSTVEASTSLLGISKSAYANRLAWASAYKKYPGSKESYTHPETIQVGETKFQYRQKSNAHHNHLGDFFMESDHGAYTKTLDDINQITGSTIDILNRTNEIEVAKWMHAFVRSGQAITLEMVQRIKPTGTVHDVNNLNRICYHCFVKETASWMLPADSNHELPFAVAQARVLKLLIEGHISIKDAFGQNSPYGVFTGSNLGENIEGVKAKIKAVNKLYNDLILKNEPENRGTITTFLREHTKAKLVTRRIRIYRELRETYGGDEDTDSEGKGYESDEEVTKLPQPKP